MLMRHSIWGLGFLLVVGCVNIRPPHIGVIMMSENYYASKTATVLLEEPKKPFEIIAMIEGQSRGNHSYTDVANAMKKKAGELGADAIVLAPLTRVPGFIAKGNEYINIKGAAIKFTETNSTKQTQ